MKGVYEVERRGNSYAVYSPSGSKLESFRTYKEAKEKADALNLALAASINN